MNKLIKKPELLAPAGNLEKLKWAIMYGADAVYIGGRNYGLRANNDNFSIEDIKQACIYAHQNNAKIYVTVNIIFHNKDVLGLDEYLVLLNDCNVDAIIISDPLVIDVMKRLKLNMDIFLSTQQSTISYEAVNFWYNEGIKRIILAREASKEDIKASIENSQAEIEVFVHGAMCVGYSGRCTLSNYLTARDSNRGGCSQICRWVFELQDKEHKSIDSDVPFSIAPKDLSMLKFIPDLISLGVSSFKIEGRMRSIYYLSTIIRIYRKVIDEYCDNPSKYEYNIGYEKELMRCANRDSVPQYFDKYPGVNEQYYNGRDEVSNQDFLGVVIDYDDINKEAIIQERNHFKIGDKVEIFGPNFDTISLNIEYIKNKDNELVDAARHPEEIVRIPLDQKVPVNSLMRIKINI